MHTSNRANSFWGRWVKVDYQNLITQSLTCTRELEFILLEEEKKLLEEEKKTLPFLFPGEKENK